uniref:Protein AMBP n=1 Tax=Anser cygnoides TaxID=8845 RepID=A0A8B9DT39_ANSCY
MCAGDLLVLSLQGQMYGKWYDVAIGTTCKWMKNYKEKFNMGTLVLGPGPSADQISTISTRLRQGDCTHISGEYQKTSTPGKYTYYNPKWDVSIKSYVLRTNYEEYAVILMKKTSSYGPSTTLKLYGRSPELREDLIEAFRQLALEMGIPADSIFILANKGECVPQETATAPERARRAVLPPEEGSAAGPLPPYVGNKEDACRLSRDPGPCSGMLSRFFYNVSSMACETFLYGGCLGNGNNFYSEKGCLQACRTEGEQAWGREGGEGMRRAGEVRPSLQPQRGLRATPSPVCPRGSRSCWPAAAPSPCSCLQAAHRPGALPEASAALGLRCGPGQVHQVQLRRLQGQWEPVLLGEGVQGVLRGSSTGRG